MTRAVLTLPGDWTTIELTDPLQRNRQIDALVVHRVGRGDNRATLRRQLRDQLTTQADQAAQVGGWLLAFMHLAADGVAASASLTAHQLPWSRATNGLDPLATQLTQEPGDSTLHHGTARFGSFLRTVRYHDLDNQHTQLMCVDYWCDLNHDTLMNLAFTTPTIIIDTQLTTLFDAITGTLVLRDDTTPDPPQGKKHD